MKPRGRVMKKQLVPLYEGILREEQDEQLGSDMAAAGKQIAAALNQVLTKAKEEADGEVNEAFDPISVAGYVLSFASLLNVIAKWGHKLAKKHKLENTAEAADWIAHKSHEFEEACKKPIEIVVKWFVKDKRAVKLITESLFVLVLLYYAWDAGKQVYEALLQHDSFKGGVNTLKAALKGKDIASIIKVAAPLAQADNFG